MTRRNVFCWRPPCPGDCSAKMTQCCEAGQSLHHLAGNANHRGDGLRRCHTHPATVAGSCLRASPPVRTLKGTGVSIEDANLIDCSDVTGSVGRGEDVQTVEAGSRIGVAVCGNPHGELRSTRGHHNVCSEVGGSE